MSRLKKLHFQNFFRVFELGFGLLMETLTFYKFDIFFKVFLEEFSKVIAYHQKSIVDDAKFFLPMHGPTSYHEFFFSFFFFLPIKYACYV